MTETLTEDELLRMSMGLCPDCGYRGFLLGPRGGAAQNIECGSLACRSRFNVTNMGWQMIVMGQRLGKPP